MDIQKAAVIGHPIAHTMSPFIQKKLFEMSHIPMEYAVLDVPDLPAALPQLRRHLPQAASPSTEIGTTGSHNEKNS